VTLADSVAAKVSVSSTGYVAYRMGVAGRRQLAWFDRSGTALGTVGEPDGSLTYPRVSPDGRRVAAARTVQGNQDIWLLDGTRTSRLTFDTAVESAPIWSPDGSRIVFDSNRKGPRNLYLKPSSSAGAEELLLESPQLKTAYGWSADGRFLLYQSIDPTTNMDLWVLPMKGDRTPWAFLRTDFSERMGQFSPDGRWVAFMSNESGRTDIYIRPFVEPSPPGTASQTAGAPDVQWQVSTAGGLYPLWRHDGREIYYIGPSGEMMATPIAVTGTALEPGTPMALFPARIVGGGVDDGQGRQYDVAPDGRFLINTELESATAPITLLMNWNPEAKK
jgi:Tol biopolymer transport system component